jgi:hypothetical protein
LRFHVRADEAHHEGAAIGQFMDRSVAAGPFGPTACRAVETKANPSPPRANRSYRLAPRKNGSADFGAELHHSVLEPNCAQVGLVSRHR